MPGLGRLLKDAREDRKWTQDDLVERTKQIGEPVSKNAISRIERDLMSPGASVLRALCRALKIDPREALGLVQADADGFVADVRRVARWMLREAGDDGRFREILAGYDEPVLEDPGEESGAGGVGTPRQEAG